MSAARPLQERLAESRVDLVAYAEGDLVERDWLPASHGLLARGARHQVAAALKSGKSLAMLTHSVSMAIAGARVVILDRENGGAEYARRLHDILADRPPEARDAVRERLVYYQWPPITLEDGAQLADAFIDVDLVIVDSTRTFLSSLHLDEDRSNDFATFATAIIEPLFKANIATLLLDNTGHSDKNRARGSSSKGDLGDVLYSMKVTGAFDATRRGGVKLVRQHARFGDVGSAFEMQLGGGHFGTFTLDGDEHDHAGGFRPTGIMQKISRAVERTPGMSRTAIRSAVTGRNEFIDLALEILILEGYLEVDRDGQAQHHRSVIAYAESDEIHRDRVDPDR